MEDLAFSPIAGITSEIPFMHLAGNLQSQQLGERRCTEKYPFQVIPPKTSLLVERPCCHEHRRRHAVRLKNRFRMMEIVGVAIVKRHSDQTCGTPFPTGEPFYEFLKTDDLVAVGEVSQMLEEPLRRDAEQLRIRRRFGHAMIQEDQPRRSIAIAYPFPFPTDSRKAGQVHDAWSLARRCAIHGFAHRRDNSICGRAVGCLQHPMKSGTGQALYGFVPSSALAGIHPETPLPLVSATGSDRVLVAGFPHCGNSRSRMPGLSRSGHIRLERTSGNDHLIVFILLIEAARIDLVERQPMEIGNRKQHIAVRLHFHILRRPTFLK